MLEEMIFETHAHYDDEAFAQDRDELLCSMKENGIGWIINACASVESLETTKKLTEQYPFIYGAAGLHPDELVGVDKGMLKVVRELCTHEKFVAVGEVGLDYFHMEMSKEEQKTWFGEFIELAREVSLPVIIHSREAAFDTMSVMKEAKADDAGGVMHCYSYSKEYAREVLDMGFYLGIGGVSTFKKARKLVETIEYAPLEALLLETDCPYMAPEPHRGKRNSSLYIPYIAEKIAQIKGVSVENVIKMTTNNALKLFKC